MKIKNIFYFFLFIFVISVPVIAQTYSSVPLNNQIYYILEQAQIRGLCSPLSGVRPYTQSVITSAIYEILNAENENKIKPIEREILEQYLAGLSAPENGLNKERGVYHYRNSTESKLPVTANIGLSADVEGSMNIDTLGNEFGTEIWIQGYLNSDFGKYVSFVFSAEGGLIKAPRRELGEYNTYYEGYNNDPESEYNNRLISVYSEPVTHFPYTYQKRWDGSIFFFDSLSTFRTWPNTLAGGYNLLSEISASFLDNKFSLRLGRLSHDWGLAPIGSSLALNRMSRPFLGIETEFNPVSWIGFSSITGILEYYNIAGIKISSQSFQNAFSATRIQFNIKDYVFLEYIDSVVWPKRFELGYISPITNSFFYQNNIGDFDNLAITLSAKVQDRKRGSLWFSFFMDEISFMNGWEGLRTLDRQMYAVQGGLKAFLPFLSFSSLKLSYTKVSPYCYTHNRNFTPWYADIRMETAYINNGVSLGHYLPPNADEILLRFETMPVKNLKTSLQYQRIRHGADFGPGAVDGSNLLSELDPSGRGTNPILKRFFLRDGAYQWLHILKLEGEWLLAKAPVSFFAETGVVMSYYSNVNDEPNTGVRQPYSIINTTTYPKTNSFILKLGIRAFPK